MTSERLEMADTYLEITQQIEALKQKAASIRESEIAGVIDRIKTAIDAYGLTAEQLFGTVASVRSAPSAGRSGRRSSGNHAAAPRFRDDTGNSWSGRGPRPRWIKAALAAGKSLDDFAVGGGAAAAVDGAPARRSIANPPAVPKYKDGEGHSWSGRGPRPRWVKAALEAGKTLDELT